MSWWTRVRGWWGSAWGRLHASGESQAQARHDAARREFHRQREWLEARFFDLAAGSGKPRGLRWIDIEFDDAVTYAQQLSTRELCAFVAVTVSFEAIEGGPMEDVAAVSNKRAATAVFRLHRGVWATDGRVLFNLSPADAIEWFGEDLVPLER